MKKVLILTNLPVPYRMSFFSEMAKSCALTVLICDLPEDHPGRDPSWFVRGDGKYQVVPLTRRVKLPGGKFVCTDVLDWLGKPFDAIYIFGYALPTCMLAEAWLRLKGIPFHLEIDGGILAPESAPKYWLKRFLIGSASAWYSSGAVTDEFFLHYGAKKEKLIRFPFSSLLREDILERPTPQEEKLAIRRRLGMTEKNIVLAVGQFIPRKGFDILLKAAADLLPDTGVYIVGGEPTEEYRELAKKTGDTKVHFAGFCQKDTLKQYFLAADVFVLPTREDIWGLVINEAMGYGLPVITTDRCVAGVELVENSVNGYLIPAEDPAALAEKTNAVLNADCIALGKASLEKIRHYTIEDMAEAHCAELNRWN